MHRLSRPSSGNSGERFPPAQLENVLSQSSRNFYQDFRNTLILMTSNLGAEAVAEFFRREEKRDSRAISVEESERRFRLLGQQLARSQFPAELVGRLDEVRVVLWSPNGPLLTVGRIRIQVLVFKPLAAEDLQRICALQLEKVVRAPLASQRGVGAAFSPDLAAAIVRWTTQERAAADGTEALGLGSGSELGQGSYGARSLWQSIQRMLLRPCARFLLEV